MAEDGDAGKDEGEAGKKKPIVLILVIVLVLAGGGAALWFFVFSDAEDEAGLEAEAEAELEVDAAADIQAERAIYLKLSPSFIVDFYVNGRQRFLKLDLAVMGRDPLAMEHLPIHLPLIRNNLVIKLGGEDFEAMKTPEGKEALRQMLLGEIQAVLTQEIGGPGIEAVLYDNFVMQ
jgi:flagellar FliL protein